MTLTYLPNGDTLVGGELERFEPPASPPFEFYWVDGRRDDPWALWAAARNRKVERALEAYR